MRETNVSLPTVEKVQQFVQALVPLDGDFELVDDHVVLDARSLMGIFAFDLSKPMRLRVYHDTPENMKAIRPFMADTEE